MQPPFTDAPGDPILTTREAAKLLGIAVSTVQLWIENGVLPAWKTPGGHRRIRLSDVGAMLRARVEPPAADFPRTGTFGASGDAADFVLAADSAHPAIEAARPAALRATGLVDSAPEAVFDRLTWLAAQVTACPIAVLTLVTAQRQWFKSRLGLVMTETPRADAFCGQTILRDETMVVLDARRDARFAANPLVTGEPYVRFYAGVPLTDSRGYRLGALCVMDNEPRRLREREMRALGELAAIAMEEIRRR